MIFVAFWIVFGITERENWEGIRDISLIQNLLTVHRLIVMNWILLYNSFNNNETISLNVHPFSLNCRTVNNRYPQDLDE